MKIRSLATGVLLSAASLAAVTVLGACNTAPLDVAEGVSLQQFQGKWYEIAKLPRVTQANCTATTATYTMTSDHELSVAHECRLGSFDGSQRRVAASAKVPNLDAPAKMSLEVSGFWGDYWIIDIDAEAKAYAVVGHPSRQYLWILSRTPELDASTLTPLLERAKAKGFEVSHLEYTPQHK